MIDKEINKALETINNSRQPAVVIDEILRSDNKALVNKILKEERIKTRTLKQQEVNKAASLLQEKSQLLKQ